MNKLNDESINNLYKYLHGYMNVLFNKSTRNYVKNTLEEQ